MQVTDKTKKCSVCGKDLVKITDELFTKMMIATYFEMTPQASAVAHVCGKCGRELCWGCTAELHAKCPNCGSPLKQDV